VKARKESEKYKRQGLELLKKYSCTDSLDHETILMHLPDEWNVNSGEYNIISYLINMFDKRLTQGENTLISS